MAGKIPKYLKQLSKKHFAAERDQVAGELAEIRKRYFEQIGVVMSNIEKGSKLEQLERSKLEALKLELENLRMELERIEATFLGRFLNLLKVRNLESQLQIGSKTKDELEEGILEIVFKNKSHGLILEKIKSAGYRSQMQQKLEEFYESVSDKWKAGEFSEDEIDSYFREDVLSKMDLDEYIAYLQKVPSHLVTHVSRFGIRDHTGHVYHTKGEGEYFDSFTRMLESQRLYSPLGVHLAEENKKDAIKKFLDLDRFQTREEFEHSCRALLNTNDDGPGSFADRSAIHFATDFVGDNYYGTEQRNEVFVVFPSMLIANEYKYSGQLNSAGDGYWNDQWVWQKEMQGMDLNAGIVFLPGNAKVSKELGSRYVLTEDKKPVFNQALRDQLVELFLNEAFRNEFIKYYDKFQNLGWRENYLKPEIIDEFLVLMNENGVIADNLDLFISLGNKVKFVDWSVAGEIDKFIVNLMSDAGLYFETVSETVSSREFWEDYFEQNPESRPSKIVYYDVSLSPSDALYSWKKRFGLTKTHKSGDLGKPESLVGCSSQYANEGGAAFRELVREIADEHFGS